MNLTSHDDHILTSADLIESAVFNILDENDGCFDLDTKDGVLAAIEFIAINFEAQGFTVDMKLIGRTFVETLARRKKWK